MCQDRIINYLVKTKREVDIVELVNKLGINRPNVSRACRVLREHHEVKSREQKIGAAIKFYYSL